MALRPEDVVEKRFNPTRLKEGYVQAEVDDFLDEVVAELRRTQAESTAANQTIATLAAQLEDLHAATSAPVAAPDPVGETTGMLALAQRLRDEHIRSGEEQAQALVEQAQQQAADVLAEIEELRARALADLETRHLDLEAEIAVLEQQVAGLVSRERTFRNQLEAFITAHLQDLRASEPALNVHPV